MVYPAGLQSRPPVDGEEVELRKFSTGWVGFAAASMPLRVRPEMVVWIQPGTTLIISHVPVWAKQNGLACLTPRAASDFVEAVFERRMNPDGRTIHPWNGLLFPWLEKDRDPVPLELLPFVDGYRTMGLRAFVKLIGSGAPKPDSPSFGPFPDAA